MLDGGKQTTPKVDFEGQVAPILKAHCVSCHGASDPAGGLNLTTLAGLRKGGASGPAVVFGKSSSSPLLIRVLGGGGKPRMPMGFPALADDQIRILRTWIDQGNGAAAINFATDILPVLKGRCESCHAGSSAAAGLDLTTAAGVKKGGVSGSLFNLKAPGSSLLLARLRGDGGKDRMPVGYAPFTPEQMDLFKRWIEAGASTEMVQTKHWAYVKPVRPPIPAVKNKAWVRNPIDAFVLAKLEKAGLKPSPQASREMMIRRVTLDLTGLPPTPKEIDAFLADKSPQAYDKVVDRLLASSQYGARQARPWLDLARYADSDGYEKDLRRSAWKYRDWLVDAFNKNLPYDEFTVEQLAGDMLPNPTMDQLVATGFNRGTMMNLEGGVDQEEAHFNVVLDRVGTTATVWMGSTLQCARCHDHKYDPFSQKDFYKMYAFFGNSVINPRGDASIGERKFYESEISVPSPEQTARVVALEAKVASLQKAVTAKTPELAAAQADWEKAALIPATWDVLEPLKVSSTDGSTLTVRDDKSIFVSGVNPATDSYTVKGTVVAQGANALRIETLPEDSLAYKGPGRATSGNFILTKVVVKSRGKDVPLKSVYSDFVQQGYNIERVLAGDVNSGWAIVPATGQSHSLYVETEGMPGGPVEVTLEFRSPQWANHNLGNFRLSTTKTAHPEALYVPPAIQRMVAKAVRSDEEKAQIASYYALISPVTRPVQKELDQTRADLAAVKAEIPTTLVMRDKPAKGPLTAYVHNRGEFLNPTELVTADTPAVLPPMPSTLPKNRLGLARWMVSKDNPLTARVEANRMWELYFGRGIVETSEDFGTQGSRPSNPELLDWLATEFMARKWDMKAMTRLIVTSATYRQTSDATPLLMSKDPQNILLARGPRFRMEAEMIRDTALATAGMLNLKLGGPPVFPVQPPNVWDSPYSGEQWMESDGANKYRRGLYTFWKRTATYPAFMAFDAMSREECTVRRIRTNTPLQALEMLNDEAMMQAAKGLAKRLQSEAGAGLTARVVYGFRLTTGRRPLPAETARIEALYGKLVQRYKTDPASAKKLGKSADQAAWTMVANVLLNLDETITKE